MHKVARPAPARTPEHLTRELGREYWLVKDAESHLFRGERDFGGKDAGPPGQTEAAAAAVEEEDEGGKSEQTERGE